MLSIYRRHRKDCKNADDRASRKCRCALWCDGTVEGRHVRRSLKTRNWERAETLKRQIENGEKPQQPKSITIKDALDAFISDCEARQLNASTQSKYNLLRNRLAAFAVRHHLTGITELSAENVRRFREGRSLSARTSAKELERLRSFFGFCISNGWLQQNPAKAVKAPEIKPSPTLPFTDAEVAKLMEHADFRTRTFFRVLLHSGLRIIDAAALRPEKIVNGRLFLYTQKTGTPVFVPLPPDLVSELDSIPLVRGFYFAVLSDNPVVTADYYRNKLLKCAEKAGLKEKKKRGKIHPHRFRDTFAVRLLEKGVPLETVSILLGHTDLKTTQRSYAPWVQSLQDNLEAAVAKTWKPALQIVPKRG